MTYRTSSTVAYPRPHPLLQSEPQPGCRRQWPHDDIFATATIINVRDAVQDWSRTRGVSLGVPSISTFVDHGYYDQFLGGWFEYRVFAEQLNLCSAIWKRPSGGDHLNVILEACKKRLVHRCDGIGP